MNTPHLSSARLLAAATMLAVTLATAQQQPASPPAPGLDGAWLAQIRTASGRDYKAELNLDRNGGGRWQLAIRSTPDPCVGLPTPVSWRPAESQGIELKLHGSQALTGCADTAISFKQTGDKTYQGRTPNGSDITLVRQ